MKAPYSEIVGHETAVEILHAVVRRGRTAHAYLFGGPEGVGKRTVAMEFARTLLCDRRGEHDSGDPGSIGSSSGAQRPVAVAKSEARMPSSATAKSADHGREARACDDCRRVREGTHPHLHVLRREEEKQDIAIKQVRELIASLALKPVLRKPRVVIVDDAERLSEEAMNALLKTLEEPPALCLFILVTASATSLLPTILSRCHIVRFGPVPEDLVRRHLESLGRDPREAALAARLHGGRIGRALADAAETTAARARMEEVLGHIAAKDVNAIVEALTKIREPQKSRREATLVLDLLMLVLREMHRAKLDGRDADPDLVPENAARALGGLSAEELLRRIETLLDHRHYLDLNANVGLTVENALLRI